ncbi:hypothetical protein P7M43_27190 [Vibrio parahaemolyticus]|nr:hypothetical protein [Vibrio parahaemolyticus]
MLVLKNFSDPVALQQIKDELEKATKAKKPAKAQFSVINNPGGNTDLLGELEDAIDDALSNSVDIEITFHGTIASCAAVFMSDMIFLASSEPHLTYKFIYPLDILFHKPRLEIKGTLFPPLQKIDLSKQVSSINADESHFQIAFQAFIVWYQSTYSATLNVSDRLDLYNSNQDVKFFINEVSDD